MTNLTFGALKAGNPYYNIDSGVVKTPEKSSVHSSETKQQEAPQVPAPAETTTTPVQPESIQTAVVKDEVKPAENIESVIAFFKANPDKASELLTGLQNLAKPTDTKSS